MKPRLVYYIFTVVFASSALAADNAVITERETKIEHAALCADADLLTVQVQQIEAELAAKPGDPALLYSRAFAHYAEASLARAQKDKNKTEAQLEAAAKLLEQIKDPAWEVETVALHGYVLNQLIGVNGGKSAMSLGPESSSLLDQAGGKAPDNPRVMFFRGVSLVTTPEMWGGDLAGGIQLLERADEAFKKQAKDAVVHWGRAEALAWLGIAKKKSGDLNGARKAWESALAVEAEYGWVKYVLLPSLAKAAEKSMK